MPYVAGLSFSVRPTAAKGTRVSALAVRNENDEYKLANPVAVYRMVTNAFVADGGDGFVTLKNTSGFRSDTGIIDSDAFRDYLKSLGSVSNPTERRIRGFP